MIQANSDNENRTAPEQKAPDERAIRMRSFVSSSDTALEYTLTGDRAELHLRFTPNIPGAEPEEMTYAGDHAEGMRELVSDLRAEIAAYLDAADSSSFAKQQGLAPTEGIRSLSDYYGEYSRTALYAYEALLNQTELDLRHTLAWQPLEQGREDWLYSGPSAQDWERGCVGHLRGDFGRDGNEFWTSWFDHMGNLNTPAFREEMQDAVNSLRRRGGLLQNFASMSRQCRSGLPVDESFGFRAETRDYTFCLRCTPRRGDYNFYLYAYDKNAQREHARNKEREKPIREHKVSHKTMNNEMER